VKGWTSPLVAAGLILGNIAASTWQEALAGAVGAVGLLALAPVPAKTIAFRMRPFVYFAAVTLVLGGLGQGRTIVALGPFHWGSESVQAAGVAAIRLIVLGAVFSWVTLRVGVARLVSVVWLAGRRFKRSGLNLDPLLLAFTVAVRFLPLLQDEARRLRLAWEARGGALAGGGLLRGLAGHFKSAVALTIPLLAAALRRAEDYANAVEIRTRGGEIEPTSPPVAGIEDLDDGASSRRLVPGGRLRAAGCIIAAWSGVIVKVWNWF